MGLYQVVGSRLLPCISRISSYFEVYKKNKKFTLHCSGLVLTGLEKNTEKNDRIFTDMTGNDSVKS